MPETYTSGIWIVKEGEEDAFVAAWKQFAQWAIEKRDWQPAVCWQDPVGERLVEASVILAFNEGLAQAFVGSD